MRLSSSRISRAHCTPAIASACAWTWSRRCSTVRAQRCWSASTVTATTAASAASTIARTTALPRQALRVIAVPAIARWWCRRPAPAPRARRGAAPTRRATASDRAIHPARRGSRRAGPRCHPRARMPSARRPRLVEMRPIVDGDGTVGEPVADALTGGAGLVARFAAGARETDRGIAGGVGSADPGRLRRVPGAHGARHGGAHVGFEPGEQRIERAPACRFLGKARLALGERACRAIAKQRDHREDRKRDQDLDQREAGAAGRACGHGRCGWPR